MNRPRLHALLLVAAAPSVAAATPLSELAESIEPGEWAQLSTDDLLPTIAEQGVPGYESGTWHGLVAPRGTPPAVVKRLHAEVVKVLQSPEVSKRFGATGVEPQTNTPAAFAEMIRKEIVVWRKVVTDANIRID